MEGRRTCWPVFKTNLFQLTLSWGLSRTRTKIKQNGKFIFMGMKVVQSGGCKVETASTKDFLPKSCEDLVLLQLQLKDSTRKMAICCPKQEVQFSLVNKQPNSFK